MTCRECELALGMEESGAAVQQHLAECDSCNELSQVMRANMDAMRALASDPLPSLRPRRRGRWQWAVAAAAMVLMMLGLSRMWPVEKIPEVASGQWSVASGAVTPPQVEIPPVKAPVKRRVPRRRRTERAQPLMVKMFTSDPNVVIYWLIDSKEGTE